MPDRVDTYLQYLISAAEVYRRGVEVDPDYWSGYYTASTALLGRELRHQLRLTGELHRGWRYVGPLFAGEEHDKDHLVPNRCMLERLAEMQLNWLDEQDVGLARRFVRDHLILCSIPQPMHVALEQSEMHCDDWHLDFENPPDKQRRLWCRVLTAFPNLQVPLYGQPTADFVPLN